MERKDIAAFTPLTICHRGPPAVGVRTLVRRRGRHPAPQSLRAATLRACKSGGFHPGKLLRMVGCPRSIVWSSPMVVAGVPGPWIARISSRCTGCRGSIAIPLRKDQCTSLENECVPRFHAGWIASRILVQSGSEW
eukprot:6827493-Heterocapsa_arctica.AAC.1